MAARDFWIPFDWLSLFKVGNRIVPLQDNPSTIYVYFGYRTPFRYGGSGDRWTVFRPQRVFESPLPNAFALNIASVHRGREVNPAKDTRRTIFSRCFRKTPELAGNARVRCTARHRETDEVCVEKPGHYRSHGSPRHRMGRGVIRYRWGRKVTQPFAV